MSDPTITAPSKSWSVEDNITILHLIRNRWVPALIADAIGRTEKEVLERIEYLCPMPRTTAKIDGSIRRMKLRAAAASAAADVAKPRVYWTPERDLELATSIITSRGYKPTAISMGLSDTVVRDRWNLLLPVKNLDRQIELLQRLFSEVVK